MDSFTDRMIRAARLDPTLYEEVEADSSAMGQAIGVVVLSSAAAGVAAIARVGVGGIVVGTIAALVAWYVWAFLAYLIGTKLLPEPQTKADMGEMLRAIGFSTAPGMIRVLGIVPPLYPIVFVGASVWMLVAMVIAVRQALDYSGTGRAAAVCLIGWVAYLGVSWLLLSLFVRGWEAG